MGSSKAFIILGLLLAMVLLISSQVAARELSETSVAKEAEHNNVVVDHRGSEYPGYGGGRHGGGGYPGPGGGGRGGYPGHGPGGGGRGGYPGHGPGGGGGYPGHGPGGGGGYPGPCGRRRCCGYRGGCNRCC